MSTQRDKKARTVHYTCDGMDCEVTSPVAKGFRASLKLPQQLCHNGWQWGYVHHWCPEHNTQTKTSTAQGVANGALGGIIAGSIFGS